MADNPNKRTEAAETGEGEQKEMAGARGGAANAAWRSLGRKALAIMLACSLIANGAILLTVYFRATDSASSMPPEISLGDFRYTASPSAERGIAGTEFSLHLALLNEVHAAAQDRVAARRHRIRQAVEEVLRRAHGGDFEDPALGDLKRQLQERINTVLEMRAIAEVIVTDLVVQSSADRVDGIVPSSDMALREPATR